MKSCKEIRARSWTLLQGKWFWRLMLVGLALQFVTGFVNGLVSSAFASLSIHSLSEFLMSKFRAMQSGLDYTLPTVRATVWMYGGFLFQSFIAYIFGAILVYGFMRTLLKADADDENQWFAEAFGGFARPFEVTWLLALMNLRVFLWSLLFFVPGIVAAYRYRLAWFLKNEHADWSASKCLAESGCLMQGCKWNAFCLDFSYVGWFALVMLLMSVSLVIGNGGIAFGGAIGMLIGAFAFYLFVKVILGFLVSRVVFYREIVPRSVA